MRCLFEVVDVAMVGGDVILPWAADVQEPISVILGAGTPTFAACGSSVGRGSAMQMLSCSPSPGGVVLVPPFSTANAAVAPASTAKLVTFTVETAGDCSTGTSFPLL